MTGVIEEDEIDLGELLATWWAQWPTVVGSAISGLALAGAYAFLIAPSEYEASAALRVEPHAFCPAVAAPCSVSLEAALDSAAASALLPAAVEALEPELSLLGDPFYAFDDRPVTPIGVSLRLAETVRIDVAGSSATVTVEHSDEARAVALANAIAGYMLMELAATRSGELAQAEAAARRLLTSLSTPAGTLGEAEALIVIERSAVVARLEGIAEAQQAADPVAVLARPAALPADQTAPRTPLVLALGMFLGLFVGLGAALVRGRRNGTLYSARAIGDAFRQAGLPAKALVRLDRRRPLLGWQEAWLAIGTEARVTAIVAAAADRRVREAAFGLRDAATRPLTLLDLAGWDSGAAQTDSARDLRIAVPAELVETIPPLREGEGRVLLLAPRAERDLAGLAQVLDAADAALVLAQPGQITRADVDRLALASRGRLDQVLVVAV